MSATTSHSVVVPRDALQFAYDIVTIVGCVPGPKSPDDDAKIQALKDALESAGPADIPAEWHEDMRKAWEREKERADQLARDLSAVRQSAGADDARDAARYRWLRECTGPVCAGIAESDPVQWLDSTDLDAAIDAELAKSVATDRDGGSNG